MAEAESVGIAAVARQVGLSPHTLRAWEQRYGFPMPMRDANGTRSYAPEQVRKLGLIRRLTDRGHRPGRIARLSAVELEGLLAEFGHDGATAPAVSDAEAYLRCLASPSIAELRRRLRSGLVRQGLGPFIRDTLGPLARQVGIWWETKRIDVFQEHLFSEEAERLLRDAMTPLEEYRPTKIVLTTFPSERHGLGLLMAEALLRLEGASCIPLGLETPPAQIVRLVTQASADIVALSFSAAYADPAGRRLLSGLRRDLPPGVTLWAGGASAGMVARGLGGVSVFRELDAMVAAFRRHTLAAVGDGKPRN